MCKSIKNGMLKIWTKPILFSVYTEESKNKTESLKCEKIDFENSIDILICCFHRRECFHWD